MDPTPPGSLVITAALRGKEAALPVELGKRVARAADVFSTACFTNEAFFLSQTCACFGIR
jgi:hypothetical protein